MCEGIARTEAKLEAVDRRINGSISDIEKHIENGGKWRVAIFSTAITLLIAIGAGIYAYGINVQKIQENSKDIQTLAELIKKVVV